MEISIENMQNKIIVNGYIEKLINTTVAESLKYEGFDIPSEVNILLVDDEKIRKINKEQRDIDKATDVLSFPMLNIEEGRMISDEGDFNLDDNLILLGDIVISLEKAKEQAEQYGHSFEREVAFLISHGMFHLLGYDHMDEMAEKVMMPRQEHVLKIMGLSR